MNAIKELEDRGLIKQTVYKEDLEKLMSRKSVKFYFGIDPTADSLHIGHFTGVLMCARLQRMGHTPVLLMGGATGLIGDPSGRTDMRKMLNKQQINNNIISIKKQLSNVISFEGKNSAQIVNNADWFEKINYLDFIRDIGANLSVNKMLTAECFKQRFEKGLSFLELNYMPMQAYDFLNLFKNEDVELQIGGDDQWSNILAGADLIRRKERKDAFAFTFPLLLTSDGKKMGKTSDGAVWVDKEKTTPYEMYQFFRNVKDEEVESCLKLLTFIPMDEIKKLTKYKDEKINVAKGKLAFEIVKLIHGEADAINAEVASKSAFGDGGDDMPSINISLKAGDRFLDILCMIKLTESKSEAKRLIQGGGVRVDEEVLNDINAVVTTAHIKNKGFILHKGKKAHIKINLI